MLAIPVTEQMSIGNLRYNTRVFQVINRKKFKGMNAVGRNSNECSNANFDHFKS